MSESYPALLKKMQRAIIERDDSVDALLIPREDFPVTAQMHIYQHGYRVRLHKVVRDDFPALAKYVGEETLDAWIRAYTTATPSSHYNLDTYPLAFPAFLKALTEDSFARDLAALEGAVKEVYMLPESEPLDARMLSGDALASLRIAPRTASRLLAFDTTANAYLTAFRAGKNIASQHGLQKTFCFVYRHLHNVKRADLSENEYRVMHALTSALALSAGLEKVSDLDEGAVQAAFARFVSEGMLTL